MDTTKREFIGLLSNSIRGEKTINFNNNINLDKFIDLSSKHKVEGIIYSGLSKSGLINYIDKEKIKDLKIKTFNNGVGQLRHIKNLSEIFKIFNNEGIPVIVLKGLVVRNFYPIPEQRTMSDADILVKKENIEKIKVLLINNGYRLLEDHEASHHMAFYSSNGTIIEVHWNLFKRDGFSKKLEKYEEAIWHQVINIKVDEAACLSLGYEDLALHLCMHMASHLAGTGFGVRQLCDLVLLVEQKGKDINWGDFILKAKLYGFEKFSLIMFILCNKLFNMEIPEEIDIEKVNNTRYIDALIDEIFEAGVHGKKDMTSRFGNQLAFNFESKDSNSTIGAIKRYLLFIFPKVDNLSDKYSYAKEVKILLPIAWIHHLFNGLFRKEYTLSEKFSFLTKGASVAIKRNQLLDWMEL